MEKLNALQGYALSLLRVVAGLLFIEHGTQKLLHFPAKIPIPGVPVPAVEPWYILPAAGFEVIGGLLIIFGLLTRYASFILSGEMAFAYFMVHFQRGFFPVSNGGDPAILFCFIFLYLTFAGAGTVSLDAMRRRAAMN